VSVGPGNVQSLCPRSTTRSRRVPCIMLLPVRHGSADPIHVLSQERDEGASSNPLFLTAGQRSAIPARPQSGLWPYREVSAESISADGSQLQEIREYMAMELPTAFGPQPIQRCGLVRYHARAYLRGVRKREDCCLQQSPAASFIAEITDAVPGCSLKVGLKSLSPECSLTEFEPPPPLAFGDDTTKTFFHKGFQRCILLVGQLASLFQKAVRYLYGCFHMADHIILYGKMSRAVPLRT
jgi:hypothetical protein